MQTGLEGKSVFVSEVGNPLGESLALAFAREGANLVLGASGQTDWLSRTEQQALALGVQVAAGVYDRGSENEVLSLVGRAGEKFGAVDVLVNNMLVAHQAAALESMTFARWRDALQSELTGSLFLCRAVLPGMIERRWGRLIHCIGLEGFLGGNPATAAAHMGVVGLARGVATQYGKYNVTANCVGYGGIEGENEAQNASLRSKVNDPLARTGTLAEACSTAVYLASAGAGYITGQCYMANGGRLFL